MSKRAKHVQCELLEECVLHVTKQLISIPSYSTTNNSESSIHKINIKKTVQTRSSYGTTPSVLSNIGEWFLPESEVLTDDPEGPLAFLSKPDHSSSDPQNHQVYKHSLTIQNLKRRE